MAGVDREIDPFTRDYVSDGKGGTKTTRSAMTKLHHQFRTPKGSWFGDADAGSRFHELEQARSSVRTPRIVEDMTREACAPLVEEGAVTSPTVNVERDLDQVRYEFFTTDLQTNEDLDLGNLTPVNP